MASLILRPVASKGTVYSTVPADTPSEEIYKLVNEEVSDMGATEFSVAANNGSVLFLKYEIPENVVITSLSSFNIYTSQGSGGVAINVTPVIYSTEEVFAGSAYWQTNGADPSDYSVKQADLLDEDENFFEDMKAALNGRDLGFSHQTAATKNAPAISQEYIELVCEYEEAGKPVYYKQNGLWSELSGTVYQKANGVWEEADVSALTEAEYPIMEVN